MRSQAIQTSGAASNAVRHAPGSSYANRVYVGPVRSQP